MCGAAVVYSIPLSQFFHLTCLPVLITSDKLSYFKTEHFNKPNYIVIFFQVSSRRLLMYSQWPQAWKCEALFVWFRRKWCEKTHQDASKADNNCNRHKRSSNINNYSLNTSDRQQWKCLVPCSQSCTFPPSLLVKIYVVHNVLYINHVQEKKKGNYLYTRTVS